MFTKRVVWCFCCFLFAVLLLSSSAALGQSSSTGTVSGTVTDNSGGAVPSATVTLTEAASGSVRRTNTNDQGFYLFAYVNPGNYSVTVTKAGFKTTVVSGQVVEVGRQLSVNAALELGTVNQTVEVTVSVGSELQTMDATVGATLSGDTLVNLPNISRDASTLAVLQPGQNMNGNVGGAATDQNTFTLDGGSATDDMSGDNNTYIAGFGTALGLSRPPSAVVPIPVTSVEVFKVSTANQTADFTAGGGSQVEVVTKRGGNAVHGGAYEYYLDTNFAGANTWDNNRIGKAQPSAHFNRFGAFAGGKIPHANFLGGGWYMFGNYEGFRNPVSATFSRNFPTASLRAGLIQLNGEVVNLNPVATVDPSTGTSYAANAATCVSSSGCAKGTIPQGTVIPCTGAGGCDPRGLGINPVITALWNAYLPMPNDCGRGDGLNYCGYVATIATPQTSNFGVARIDHDFAKNWHFNGTYHYYKLANTVSDQWDIGGFFPGDTKGQYAAIRQKPQNAWIYTAGLTTDIKPGLTNDFHFSYTRNWWAYLDPSGVPNVASYPAALEIGGENSGAGSSPVFIPYNTNNQSVRTRYWNGHDFLFRDDVTWIKGNHLFQMGGSYLRNIDTHSRNDNGQSINTYEQYLIGAGNSTSLKSFGIDMTGYVPAGITSTAKYGNLYSMILGMVDSSQSLFSRSVGSLTSGLPLNPTASCKVSGAAPTLDCVSSPSILARSILPTYSVYWTDSWRMKPKFTLNYGLGYTIEMPPYETTGGYQTVMVDQNDNILYAEQYLQSVKAAALQGQAYAPAFGFAIVPNVSHHSKYPYDPYYGEISPRVGAAWNILPTTVIRGGYARIFGRINGVNPLLVPLLTPGLLQPDTCGGPSFMVSGTGAPTCGGTTPATNFRVGVDCPGSPCTAPLPLPVQNLPQPWYPGVNQIATGSGETFDPNFKPNRSDEYSLTIEHQFGPKILAEAGYIGRRITNEIEYYGLGVVPYMMTLNGQSFANAWKDVMVATNYGTLVPSSKLNGVANPAYLAYLNSLAVQPFFEAALGGSTSAYCSSKGTTSCTAAFVASNVSNMRVSDAYDAWAGVSNRGLWTFGRTLSSDPINGAFGANGQSPSLDTTVSNGYGNYHAGFLQLTTTNWHGLTVKTNFTWSKALGTGNVTQATSSYATVDPWNLRNQYGPQSYDQKYNFNLFFNYAPPYYSGQKGVLGHLLGGWSFSPLFVYGSGFPVELNTANGDCGTFGQCNTAYISSFENMVANGPLPTSGSTHFNTKGTNGCGTAGPGANVFANPNATCPAGGGVFGDPMRNPILGLDGEIGGGGWFRGLPFWNLDLGTTKKVRVNERFSGSVYFDFTNVLNHMQPRDPCFNTSDTSTWGVLGCGGSVQANTPRRFQIGVSFEF